MICLKDKDIKHSASFGWMMLSIIFLCGLSMPSWAQQATRGPAAVQPGKGLFAVRSMHNYKRVDGSNYLPDLEGDRLTVEHVIAYGLTRDLVGMVHLPLVYQDLDSSTSPQLDDENFGLDDFKVMLQWRFWQNDYGPTNTARAVLIGGLEFPSFDELFSSESVDPLLGIAGTLIHDRHGINAAATYKINTGSMDFSFNGGNGAFDSDDAFEYDLAYLYRLSPESYGLNTEASSYFMLEFNGMAETNGDHELLIAPGFLYEATTFAAEISIQLPLTQDLEERPETEFSIMAGLRFLF